MARVDPLAGVNLLDLTPQRLAEWTEREDGKVVVERPRPPGLGPRQWSGWLRYFMASRFIRLDRAGSLAWLFMDGQRTVSEVARALRDELGDEVEPAEERVGSLVKLLRREDLLAYPEHDRPGAFG